MAKREFREFKEFKDKTTKELVLGFRKTIVDGTRKNSPLMSSLLETERETIFYCSSRKAILNSQRHTRKTQFCRKLFARPAFSRKSGQYSHYIYNTRRKMASGKRRTGRIQSHIFAKNICSAEQSITP